MTIPTHIIAGMIIGKITGNYEVSVIGATFLDIDHIYAYIKRRSFASVKKFYHDAFGSHDVSGDQRGIFHNMIVFTALSSFACYYRFDIGAPFMISYASHLILDIIDASEYYPLWPSLKFPIIGFVDFFSREEFYFFLILCVVFFLI